jgi:serine/threonine protein kinase
MPAIYKPGKKVKSYEIVRELNRGAFANAYEAVCTYKGRVFFKQYKSPTKLVEWYPGFVEHQKEIKSRITKDPAAADRCYKFIDFFEEPSGFHQVFEFVEGGKTLTEVIAEQDRFSWEQMVLFTKTMMFGMKALHQVKIIHTDLKPDNIILIPDATIGMGYKLRVIDLDWAIFSDRQAPWHGKQGYIGTPRYQSPEHLSPGKIPLLASDIFTCGIMLGEALGGGHPFADAGDDYDAAAAAGRFKPIKLRQPIPKVDDPAFLEAVLNSCLDPNPTKRPTAAQVADALMGKTFGERKPPPPPPPPPVRPVHVKSKSVEIQFDGKKVALTTVDAEFGKQTFRAAHADSQFLSNPQFKLRKQDGQWVIEHCATATNETIVDGHRLTTTEPVRDGMRVAVGNSAKGVEKLPLVLKLVS